MYGRRPTTGSGHNPLLDEYFSSLTRSIGVETSQPVQSVPSNHSHITTLVDEVPEQDVHPAITGTQYLVGEADESVDDALGDDLV